MFDIVMYKGVNTVLITTITWVILRIVMGEVVCATEATHIIGQHNRDKYNGRTSDKIRPQLPHVRPNSVLG